MQIYRLEQEKLHPVSPEQAFPFLGEKKHIISLVGGGGKTTLLYALAGYYRAKGWRTAVTTTTHIAHPALQWRGKERSTDLETDCAQNASERAAEKRKVQYVTEPAGLSKCWADGNCAVCGTIAADGKLSMLSENAFQALAEEADCVLIEADGAKHFSCKAPAAHEPVLLPESDIVVGVLGLSALGKPLEEVCFRSSEASALLGVSKQHRLTAEDAARLLVSEQGTKKQVGSREYYVALNQCDTPYRRRQGMEILRLLKEQGQERAVLTEFDLSERC